VNLSFEIKLSDSPRLKEHLLPYIVYFVSWLPVSLVWRTYFWDDWFNYFDQSAMDVRRHTGPFSGFSPVRLVLEGWMAEYFPPSFRILTFLAFPLAAFALWKVLSTSHVLTRPEALGISSLFLLLPLNSARASMTIFMYTACNVFFFVGWWAYARNRQWFGKGLAVVLFLMSFDTASFIVFMVVPLALSLLESQHNHEKLTKWLQKNVIFIVIAPAYWFIEPTLNPTLDKVRAAYYTPSLSGIVRGLVVGSFVLAVTAWFLVRKKWRYSTHRGGVQVLGGLCLTWIGMFPYMALGHFPNLNALLIGFVPGSSDWDSRHQLLMPLGLAVVIVGVFNWLNPRSLLRGTIVVGLLSSILNLSFSQEYYLDSIKTTRVIEALKSNEDVRGVKFALIDDQALRFNARGRSIRSYEWDAILRAANPNLDQGTDVLRYVDCETLNPDAIIIIQATNGKLKTLLTRNPGISVTVKRIQPCA
jgi:hypothetical protein